MSINDIKNYLAKKARGRAKTELAGNRAVVSVQKFDEETETWVWTQVGTTSRAHMNDLVDAAQAARDAFAAQYQPTLDALNQKLQDLKDIRTDVRAVLPQDLK